MANEVEDFDQEDGIELEFGTTQSIEEPKTPSSLPEDQLDESILEELSGNIELEEFDFNEKFELESNDRLEEESIEDPLEIAQEEKEELLPEILEKTSTIEFDLEDLKEEVIEQASEEEIFEQIVEASVTSNSIPGPEITEHIHQSILDLKEENSRYKLDLNNTRKITLEKEEEIQQLNYYIDEKTVELKIIHKKFHEDMEKMKTQIHLLEKKNAILAEDLKLVTMERDTIKKRVTHDIQTVTKKEKELINQLEMLRVDAQSQIDHRDKKIIELRSILETVEFDRQSVLSFNQDEQQLRIKVQDRFDQLKESLRLLLLKVESE